MTGLKLYGMRSAYDETLATAIKRKHEPQRLVGDLLKSRDLREAGALDQIPAHRRQAAVGQGRRRLRLQGYADQRSPCARSGRRRIHRPATQCRPGRWNRHRQGHQPSPSRRSCIRAGSRGRFFTTVDLVKSARGRGLRAGRQGRLADYLTRLGLVILDELGYLPFAQAGGQLLFHLINRLLRARLNHRHDQPRPFGEWPRALFGPIQK